MGFVVSQPRLSTGSCHETLRGKGRGMGREMSRFVPGCLLQVGRFQKQCKVENYAKTFKVIFCF